MGYEVAIEVFRYDCGIWRLETAGVVAMVCSLEEFHEEIQKLLWQWHVAVLWMQLERVSQFSDEQEASGSQLLNSLFILIFVMMFS